MNNNIRRALYIAVLINTVVISKAQETQSVLKNVITTDSLASGNYKDILNSFYQLSVKDLTGPQRALSFSVNPFAIMVKHDPTLLIDTNYYKYRALRKLNVDFGLKLDSSYKFDGMSLNLKYALINRRDYTISRSFLEEAYQANNEYDKLNIAMKSYIDNPDSSLKANLALKNRVALEKFKLMHGQITFNQLSPDVKAILIKVAQDNNLSNFLKLIEFAPNTNIDSARKESFNGIKNSFQNKHLLTLGISDTTYKSGLFKNLGFSMESVRGFLPTNHVANLEWDILASYSLADDTTQVGQDLKRQVLYFEPGINLVIKNKESQKSYLEFKFSGSYTNILRGQYASENKIVNTINGNLRIRIFDDFWIPFQIKYDPKSGNVFGFLNVTTNFTGLGSLLKSQAKN